MRRGKTVIINRLARQEALKENALTVMINFKEWTGVHYDDWQQLHEGMAERMDFLLREFAVPHLTIAQLDALSPERKKILFVDGLNEVTSDIGSDIIATLDVFIGYALQTAVIVSDRLVRREFPNPQRWALATVMPLEDAEVERCLQGAAGNAPMFSEAKPEEKALLKTPYFLDSVLRGGTLVRGGTAVFHEYYTRHASLTKEDLIKASYAAYKAYKDNRSRTFSLSSFQNNVEDSIIRKLVDSGSLVISDDLASFAHHLQHDYLVSLYLVNAGEVSWAPDTLDVVSFRTIVVDIKDYNRHDSC